MAMSQSKGSISLISFMSHTSLFLFPSMPPTPPPLPFPPRWCNHLMAAGQMMGMKLPVRKPYERRLKDLRANQRFDK